MHFYGIATLGSKGQIVIPAEAREQFGLKTNDKLVIIGTTERNMLCVCPVESVEALLGQLTSKLNAIHKAIGEAKKVKETKTV